MQGLCQLWRHHMTWSQKLIGFSSGWDIGTKARPSHLGIGIGRLPKVRLGFYYSLFCACYQHFVFWLLTLPVSPSFLTSLFCSTISRLIAKSRKFSEWIQCVRVLFLLVWYVHKLQGWICFPEIVSCLLSAHQLLVSKISSDIYF